VHNQVIKSSVAIVTFGLTLWMANSASSINTSVARIFSNQGALERESFDQNRRLAELGKQIAGQENKPSEEVFKNIQMLKGMPAGRLLKVMELGYSKSLGVNCTHCHVVDRWEKDDKPTKQVTRDMMKMVGAINNDLLKNIKHLKSENPIVNCTTCHRGQIKPAINLPDLEHKQ
jgi:hypothetical protein